MDRRQISWRAVFAYNMRFAGGVIMLFFAWLCWHGASPEWWGLYLFAMLGFAGGGAHMIGTLTDLIKLMRRVREWNRYQDMGTTPKADPMADRKRLEDGGLIK